MENKGTEYDAALSRVASSPSDFKREDCRIGLEESKLQKSSRLDFFQVFIAFHLQSTFECLSPVVGNKALLECLI